jgi:hypothetical protein
VNGLLPIRARVAGVGTLAPTCLGTLLPISVESAKACPLRRVAVQFHVRRLGWQDHDVFRSVVVFDAVEVMHPLAARQRAASLFLSHQAMLIDVAISVCLGMLRTIDKDVALLPDPAATLPTRSRLASFAPHLMATNVADWQPLDLMPFQSCCLGNQRGLSTATQAQTRRVRRFNRRTPRRIHGFRRWCPRPVPANEGLSRRRFLAAAALAELC